MTSPFYYLQKLLVRGESSGKVFRFYLSRAFTALSIVALGSIVTACGGGNDDSTSNPPANAFAVTKPILGCADLAKANFSNIDGAPASITSATVVGSGDTSYCDVKGTTTSTTNFEVRLPMQTYTQRFLMVGCGGYCGFISTPAGVASQSAGCVPLNSNQMVTAASDLGHQAPLSSGTWANGNPSAVVDFAYSSMHKTTLVTKALITAFYGKAPTKSYYQGCSDGGREGLQEAQRYPTDFDGIVVGSPVIDEVPTNSFYHGWNVHVNSDASNQAILTADKIPTLVSFVQSSCADKGGLIQDPRACKPDLTKIQCPNGTNTAQCLTAAQISVVQQIWNGPVDESGNHLTAGDMPIGGEANWIGTMVPKTLGAPMTPANVSDAVWSSDFPNYMAQLGTPTGITYANLQFTTASFSQMMKYGSVFDPTNTDLSAFSARGGKLLVWHGWSDTGASPYMSMNYYSGVKSTMGADAQSKFMMLYMIPGVYHCNSGPNVTNEDFLTPMMNWVENGTVPGQVLVNFTASSTDKTVVKSRPVFPYPATVAYNGGDVNAASSYIKADIPAGVSDTFQWLGLSSYKAGANQSCSVTNGNVSCM
ncbi:tannase/feruloyl esterase family alpha/beta hydrolase [Caballeronia sp. GaOx3]|uniref:tannase/feruloyl esterase family alpha/beta hydrolase n=1 Tax=Caballeronia sp. GaOx3 TaxID=2921740 RepID=UPI002027C182|nr:tannase/feruloyl esterase family alpha/beta hydrolase [Caballeronia sp. GaOx3]